MGRKAWVSTQWLLFGLSVSTEHIIQFYKSQWFFFLPYRCKEYQGGGCSSTSDLTAMYHGRTTGKGPSQIYQQPPRLLIVHISLPSWADICSNLCEAMQNFFSLACSLMGPSRMSLFSLYMVQNQHECILPFVVSISVFIHFILKVNTKFLLQKPHIIVITYSNSCACSHAQYPTSNTMKARCHPAHKGALYAKEKLQNY